MLTDAERKELEDRLPELRETVDAALPFQREWEGAPDGSTVDAFITTFSPRLVDLLVRLLEEEGL